MPRNYVRKTNNASYPHEKLLEAVRAVKSGRLSGYEASKHYQIPRSTIINRVYDRKGLKSNSLGRAPVLSREVEEDLVKNLRVMEKYGLGLTRKEVMETVGQYVSANAIKTPFKNGIPGEDWFLSFKKKHGLSIKKPQPVEYARKQACSPHIINPYFDLLEETLKELELTDKPSHVWNVDETSFSKDPSKAKVVGCKGFTSTRTIATPGKDNTTVLLGCNALGEKTPPMIVFKGKNVWDQWTTDEGYPGTAYAATSNGWMETPVFEAYFEKVFLSTVGEKRPILLIYDGHATHVGINLVKKAREANITILKIPPHTSHLLQPLDLSVNKSLKDRWDIALVKWQRMNIGKPLPKQEFAKIIGQIWGALDPAICAAGFRKAGIYPLNKNVIPDNKFISSTYYYNSSGLMKDSTKTPEPCAGTSKETNPLTKENSSTIVISQPESLFTLALKSIALIDTIQDSDSHTLHTPQLQYDSVDLSNQLVGKSAVSNLISIPEQTPKIHQSNSSVIILENKIVSFEDLLLMRIKAGTSSKTKKKRVATGAEVITRDDVYKRTLEAHESEKVKKEKNTKTKQQDKKQIKDMKIDKNTKILKRKKERKVVEKNIKRKKYASSSSEIESEIKYAEESDDDDFWVNILNKSDYDKDETVLEAHESEKVKKEKKSKTKQQDKKQIKDMKIVENTKILKRKKERKAVEKNIKRKKYASSSSESESEIKYAEESDDDDFWENILNKSDDDKDETVVNKIDGDTEILNNDKENCDFNAPFCESDWVLVKFCTKKSVKHYVGIVLKINENGCPIVKYTRKKGKTEEDTVFTFPVVDDISDVKHIEDIVIKLPKPTIGRRGQIIFKMSFNSFNIQ